MTCGIYAITNTKNGKRYIGSAVNIEKRWNEHRNALRRGHHHSGHLQAAWNKYGERVFVFGVVTACDSDQLVTQEQFWIDAFQTADGKHGYNIAPKAGSSLGIKRTAETRAKVSAALRNRVDSDETKAKKSASRRGLKHSAETRAKMSLSSRRANARPEVKAKISAALKGIERSIETRLKVAAATRAAWERPDIREKMAVINVGRKHTGKARENIAAAARKNLARSEVRAKIGDASRRAWENPQTREKLLESRRGENNPKAKLTEDDVRRIRILLTTDIKQAEIARMFGVGPSCIGDIKSGKRWKYVV